MLFGINSEYDFELAVYVCLAMFSLLELLLELRLMESGSNMIFFFIFNPQEKRKWSLL
jgi:hypothetical protein